MIFFVPIPFVVVVEIVLLNKIDVFLNFVGGFMRRRHKLSRKGSRKLFSRTAQYIHPLNVHKEPMRGGFRL